MPDETTERIIEDSKTIIDQKERRRHEAKFFQAVIGGATPVVEDVLDKVDQLTDPVCKQNLYQWFLGVPSTKQTMSLLAKIKKLMQSYDKLLKMLFLIPLWVILTPMFYFVHSFINAILNDRNSRAKFFHISKYEQLDFPLAYAVFSGQEEMVKLFLQHVSIDLKDAEGHNIIHYLADLSENDLAKALKCYDMLWKMAQKGDIEQKTLCKMIETDENIHKLSATEYCCQFGGLRLACQMIHDTKTTQKITVENSAVSFEKSCQRATKKYESDMNNKDTVIRLTGKEIDVTQFDVLPRHGFMSFLLHLINSRPTIAVSKENWKYFHNDKGMATWMDYKFSQWKPLIVTITIVEIAITILLICFLVTTGGDMYFTPNQELFIRRHIQIFLKEWKNSDTAGIDRDLRTSFLTAYPDFYKDVVEKENKMDYVSFLGKIQRLNGYHNYNISDLAQLYRQLCITGSVYRQVGDLIFMDNCTIGAANELAHDCYRLIHYFKYNWWDKYEFVIASSFATPMFNDKVSKIRNILRFNSSQLYTYILVIALAIYFGLYILLDIWCRVHLLWKQISDDCTLRSIFGTPLPGSYVKGFCNVFSAFGYLTIIMYYWKGILKVYGERKTSDLMSEILTFCSCEDHSVRDNTFMSAVLVFMLLCRLILHLYVLRLFPVIGNFVIMTFEMATDLTQFCVVYILMIATFSILFYWFSRSDSCPFFNDENNHHYGYSLFTVFAFTFGHVDIEFDERPSLRMVYFAYAVMSIILLLNLIIAVMSSTAADVRAEPWKTQLYQEALNSEALGIEHWFTSIFQCKCFHRVDFYFLKRAGFKFEYGAQGTCNKVCIKYVEEETVTMN